MTQNRQRALLSCTLQPASTRAASPDMPSPGWAGARLGLLPEATPHHIRQHHITWFLVVFHIYSRIPHIPHPRDVAPQEQKSIKRSKPSVPSNPTKQNVYNIDEPTSYTHIRLRKKTTRHALLLTKPTRHQMGDGRQKNAQTSLPHHAKTVPQQSIATEHQTPHSKQATPFYFRRPQQHSRPDTPKQVP